MHIEGEKMALSLVHLKGNTYYVPSLTNIGIYIKDNEAILIDSGNDKEAARQILKLLNNEGLKLRMIVNTHSNADHIGGNKYLQEKTDCEILATRIESAFINDPILESAFLFGGNPFKNLKNKFLMANQSNVTKIISYGEIEETNLKAVPLPGHFFDMIGILTKDDVFFIADSIFPENVINKYHIFYIFDVKSFLDTLDYLKNFDAEIFVPSHGEPVENIGNLVELNKNAVNNVVNDILNICKTPQTYEEILEKVCDLYNIYLDFNQYALLSSSIKSYLTYIYNEAKLDIIINKGRLEWRTN